MRELFFQHKEINALNSKRTQDGIAFNTVHKKMKNLSPIKITSSRRSISAVKLNKLRIRRMTPLLLMPINDALARP